MERIIAIVQALLQKTTENGCTESEALAAAEKAQELIAEHELDAVALKENAEEAIRTLWTSKGRKIHEVQNIASAIGNFCECRTSILKQKDLYTQTYKRSISFIGLEHDVMLAYFLVDMFKSVMDLQWKIYLNSGQRPENVHGRRLRTNFMLGMALRISERLHELAEERTALRGDDSRALVISKNVLIQKKTDDLGLKKPRKNQTYYYPNAGAMEAGQAAGDRVNITTGINKGTSGHAIGYTG